MEKYKDLVPMAQGFVTNVFMDKITGEIKVFRGYADEDPNLKGVSEEGRKQIKKIYRLYKKLPPNYSRLPKLTEDEIGKIWKRTRNILLKEQYLKDAGVNTEGMNGVEIMHQFHEQLKNDMPEQMNVHIGSAIGTNLANQLNRIKSLGGKDYMFKKLYRRHRRLVKKHGLSGALARTRTHYSYNSVVNGDKQ